MVRWGIQLRLVQNFSPKMVWPTRSVGVSFTHPNWHLT